MDISAMSGSGTYQGSQIQKTPGQNMGQEDFMQLLVAQLQNQDPLSPMESQEFTTQLTQFNSLEQLKSIDGKMDDNIDVDVVLTQSINNTMAATMIGKEVTAVGNAVALTDGEATNVNFKLAGFADDVTVKILDSAGNEVKTIEAHSMSAGYRSLEWDGTNNDGETVPDGNYTFSVVAESSDGNKIGANTMIVGLIDSVRYDSGSAILMVNGTQVQFSDVLQIGSHVNEEEV